MQLEPSIVFHDLISREPKRLGFLPHDHGIYALHDHTGAIRYIGITKSIDSGLFNRINSRYVTGSEGRSRKFSHAYNHVACQEGWALRCQPGEAFALGVHSTTLRSDVRSGASFNSDRTAQAGDRRPGVGSRAYARLGWKLALASLAEPKELVDSLLDDLCFSPEQRAAIERQAALYAALYD